MKLDADTKHFIFTLSLLYFYVTFTFHFNFCYIVVECPVPCLENGIAIIDAYEDNETTWETGAVVGGSTMMYLCDDMYKYVPTKTRIIYSLTSDRITMDI